MVERVRIGYNLATVSAGAELNRVAISKIKVGKRHRRDLGDIAALAESVRHVGLLHPIVVRPDGTLIAGERRLKACKLLGWTEVPITVVPIDDIVRGEFAENAHRKDFLPSEIDAIRRVLEPFEKAAAEQRMKAGTPAKVSHGSGRASDRIGAFAGVSGRQVEKIAAVVDAAKQEPQRFSHLVEEMDEHGVDRAHRALRRAEWTARTVELSKANAPLTCDRRYPVILADPPWPYEAYNAASGMERAAESHYPCMSIEDICALPIADIATSDAALFLWTTSPHLQTAFSVLEAWGFHYVTNIVWVKNSPGLGYWVRNQHELLLIAARGKMRSPPEGLRPSSVIEAPRREHSQKPDEAYELIEKMYPELPKIELFARQSTRPSWAAWGNESEAAA